MSEGNAVSIDLATTRTTIAPIRPRESEAVENADGTSVYTNCGSDSITFLLDIKVDN